MTFSQAVNSAIHDLEDHIEIKRQSAPSITSLYGFNRHGLRYAIASIDDENLELWEVWRNNKNNLGNAVPEIRHELLDVAMCAILAYMDTYYDRS